MVRIKFFILFLFFGVITFAQSDNNSFYIWNTNSLHGKIVNKVGYSLGQKKHFNINELKANLFYYEAILKYPLNNQLTLGTGFRHYNFKVTNRWNSENRYMTYLYFKNKKKSCKLFFTNRLSYRQFHESENHFRYYHKLMIVKPLILFSKTIRPFIAEEVFVKLNKDNFHLCRLFLGTKLIENRPVKLDLYFAKTFQKHAIRKWGNYNLLGFNISIYI